MIVTKIENPKKSATKVQRVAGLADYITAPETANALEKCIHSETLNFVTDDYETQKMEMIALAEEATRSKDTVDHWVISWQPHERPTVGQARQAVAIFMKHTGLEGHQCVWGLHDDTTNMHVHVEINRVHPDTLRVVKIHNGWWKEAGQQVACLIEYEQGWQGVPGARYEIENGTLKKLDLPDKETKPGSVAESKELQTGEKSAQRIGIENAAPIIAQATSWRELHAGLAAIGMSYRREGSGAKVYVGGIGIKASDVDRKAAFGALQKRLGEYQPATEFDKNDYYHHTAQPHPTALGEDAGHSLRNLSECRLAFSDKGEYGRTKRAGILQIDARTDRQESDGMRRDSRGGRSLGIELKPNQPGWKEYVGLRDERKTTKALATSTLKTKHDADRTALYEAQKAERKRILAGSWRGRGDERNAIQSALAVQHAAAKADLQAQHSQDRRTLQAEFAPLPQYKAWAEQPRLMQAIKHEPDQIQVAPGRSQQLANTLRSLSSTAGRLGITYEIGGHAIFRDEGKNIAVLDLKSDLSVAAALATAKQKFGNTLTLTGSSEAQHRIVAVAVAQGLHVKFADPELETYRQGLMQAKETRARTARMPLSDENVKETNSMATQNQRELAKAATRRKTEQPSYMPSKEELKAVDEVLIEQARERLAADFNAKYQGLKEANPLQMRHGTLVESHGDRAIYRSGRELFVGRAPDTSTTISKENDQTLAR